MMVEKKITVTIENCSQCPYFYVGSLKGGGANSSCTSWMNFCGCFDGGIYREIPTYCGKPVFPKWCPQDHVPMEEK